MRIGIVTLPLHTNYGGILQAYALQTVLERMGHEVRVINSRSPLPSSFRLLLRWGKRTMLKWLSLIKPLKRATTEEEWFEISRFTHTFINLHIKIFKCVDFEGIDSTTFDAYIVGSDQVWRYVYFSENNPEKMKKAFLSFTEGWKVKRISYAASFGTDDWEYPSLSTEECAHYIRLFDAVSVREASGIILCKRFLHFDNAIHVLDPTMLLNMDDYRYLISQVQQKSQAGTIMCYILDESNYKFSLISSMEEKLKTKAFHTAAFPDDSTKPIKQRIQPPVEQWIRGFCDCDYVITDSFHACVFSILFHRPFYVVGNPYRGMARFQSLLSAFGLEKCLLTEGDDFPKDMPVIHWTEVDQQLEVWRKVSNTFLKEALNGK